MRIATPFPAKTFPDLLKGPVGLRIRLIYMLCAVVVPVLALVLGWTFNELAIVSQVRITAAEDSTSLAASRLEQLFQSLRIASRVFSIGAGRTEPASLCRQFQPIVQEIAGSGAEVAFYDGLRVSCATSIAAAPSRESLVAVKEHLFAGEEPAILGAPAPSPLTIGILHGGRGAESFFVIDIPRHELLRRLNPVSLMNAKAAAIVTDAGQILDSWPAGAAAASGQESWLPKDLSKATSKSFKSDARNGIETLFVTAPAGPNGERLIVSYQASPFFTPERHQFYQVALGFLAILAAMIIGIVWALDHSLTRWIIYLRRIAIAHAKGRWSVRAARLEDAPHEFRELGEAVNYMAEHISDHAQKLETALTEKAALLQELHHRVKNNFQVIASLLSLHKKGLPPERWNETRFLEEHVCAMAIAYRTSYAAGSPKRVPPIQLICDVIEALRETANIRADCVHMVCVPDETDIDLDRAIALGLYIAYFLPPYLTRDINNRHPLTVVATLDGPLLKLDFTNLPQREAMQPSLRDRLAEAYARQIGAHVKVSVNDSELSIQVSIHPPGEIAA